MKPEIRLHLIVIKLLFLGSVPTGTFFDSGNSFFHIELRISLDFHESGLIIGIKFFDTLNF